MIKQDLSTIENRQAQGFRFLLCDTTSNLDEQSSFGEEWVASPIQCLDKAVDGRPGIIVIRFGNMPIREREALVELCAALKRNSHTRQCPVLALLHSKHRKLIEELEQAKVDYIRYLGGDKLDSTRLKDIIDGLGPNDRLERHLARICPFLHYRKIDAQHEMTVCGACRDRMVIGGRWLHEICHTRDHLHCEYYLNPRLKA
jgi:hypothetical protein